MLLNRKQNVIDQLIMEVKEYCDSMDLPSPSGHKYSRDPWTGEFSSDDFDSYLSINQTTTFIDDVIKIINRKGYKDPEVYTRAHLDRRIFSKMMSDHTYSPSKDTAVMLSFGLELTVDEAIELLKKSGFTLGFGSRRDLTIRYFLMKGIYDITLLNQVLAELGERIIGRRK